MARKNKVSTQARRELSGFGTRPASNYKELPKMAQKKETKSFFSDGFFEPFLWGGWGNMSSYLSLQYYRQVSTLAIGIDMVSDKVSMIAPIIYDTEAEEMLQKDSRYPSLGILKLLQYPNMDVTYQELVKRWVNFYKITGNSFFLATGPVDEPPLELFIPPAQNVTLIPGHDGFTQTMHLNTGSYTETFERTIIKGRVKFYNKYRTAELYHTRAFNPYIGGGVQNYGISELCAIYYEIEQHILGSIHNLSLLQKGGRMSGALINKGEPLSDNQFMRMQQQINMQYQGAENAGRIILLEADGSQGGGMEFIEMGINNKDMDYAELSKRSEHTIFRRLKIPLALMETSSMTLDNYSTANLVFHDDAVLPMANMFCKELSDMLIHRYKDSENQIITYDLESIPALRFRTIQQVKAKKDLDIYTPNELRAELGDPPLDGGNVILRPLNLYPAASDGNPSYVRPANIWAEEYANGDEKYDNVIPFQKEFHDRKRELFIYNMAKKFRNYSPQQLIRLANRYGF